MSIAPDSADTPRLLLLARLLKLYGLGYDLRYGSLCIDTLDSIAAWHDSSGVTHLVPSPGTKLSEAWYKRPSGEFAEMPLNDLLEYVSACHDVPINRAALPDRERESGARPAKDTPVTINFHEASLKNALALVLSAVGCTASIDGETIVVRPR